MRRAFAGIAPRALDPFIMMDQMGEVEYAPGEPKGTSWHPHRGFETVTYIMDGAFQHQDSHGGGGFITDGATQWMTVYEARSGNLSRCGASARQMPALYAMWENPSTFEGKWEPSRQTAG